MTAPATGPSGGDAQRFADLLPDYLSGSLPPADAAWVVAHAARHPASAQELRWWRQMRADLREQAAQEPLQGGLEQLRARMRQAPPAPAATASPAPQPGGAPATPSAAGRPGARTRRPTPWLPRWFTQPAGALATLVIVAQAGWIAWHEARPPEDLAWRGMGVEAMREAPPATVATTARIALQLRPGTLAEALAPLLAGHPGRRLVLDGAAGWLLEVPADDAPAALQAARAHPAVLKAEAP